MGSPKFSERRKPANAELRSALGAIELWIRHAAVRKSGVIKVTHHELVTIHDALILALREDNPQLLLVVDTDGGNRVRKDIVNEASEGDTKNDNTDGISIGNADGASGLEPKRAAESGPDIDPKNDIESRADDADSDEKA